MKFLSYLILIVFSLSLYATSAPIGEVRSFTRASDNKVIKASIVSYDGEQVVLKVIGKKNYTVDPSIFIKENQEYIENWININRNLPLPSELDKRIKPGETFRVEMPNLAKTFTKKTAGFTVYIPTDYNYPNPAPLLVFLNGGSGSEELTQAKEITDSRDYILVSLPFTSEIKKDGHLGQSEKNMNLIKSYHAAMLQKLYKVIPNLSHHQRVIVGSSNGAHIIGSALAMDWDCYLKSFHAFALWEGGGSISRDFKAAKGKKYQTWVGWGGKSQFKDFTINIAETMEKSGVEVTKKSVETAAHTMNTDASSAIREWLINTAEPHMQKLQK